MARDPAAEIERALLHDPPAALGVAVSGGGDSLALLLVLHEVAGRHGISLRAVTVDHGLRAEAAAEAQFVNETCVRLNISHDVVRWTDWDGQGNLQDQARRARYRLIADWARAHDISHVALGHTLDDQAETVVMRLARGSGVDGLSGMSMRWQSRGITWLRPMLAVERRHLRDFLTSRNQRWVDDPSNDDPRFDRVKARQALAHLAPLGISAEALGQVAQNMASARRALHWQVSQAARDIVRVHAGSLRFDWDRLEMLPGEIRRRILLRGLAWLSGSDYPPRRQSLDAAVDALRQTRSATLDGCLMRRKSADLWIGREPRTVQDLRVPLGGLWDGRWRLTGGVPPDDAHIGAVGEDGLAACPQWRDLGLPREILMVTPALWVHDNLISAPLVKSDDTWQAVLERDEMAFFDAPLSH